MPGPYRPTRCVTDATPPDRSIRGLNPPKDDGLDFPAPLKSEPHMLARLGRWCHDNRWRVVIAWIAAIVLLVVATAGAGQNFGASFETPDSEGGDGFDLIDEYFGGQGSGFPGRVVFRAEQGVDDPSVREPMEAYFAELAAEDGISVISPYDERAFGQISEDGTIAFAQVEAPSTITDSEAQELGPELKDLAPRSTSKWSSAASCSSSSSRRSPRSSASRSPSSS